MSDSFSLSVDLDALAERIAARLPASGGQRGALTVGHFLTRDDLIAAAERQVAERKRG